MTIFNRADAAPFTTADGSTIREFLNAGNSGLRNQSLAEATLAPRQCTQAHFHPLAEEIYFITQGVGIMKIEGETREVRIGDAIAIPNGYKHQICNSGAETLIFLWACARVYSHEDTILVEKMGD